MEAQLCEHFSVSRARIREVLRQLEQDGFVQIIPNVGAVVTEFSQKDLDHSYDLMGVLEGLAVRASTPYITNQQLREIEHLVEMMDSSDSAALYHKYNVGFHELLISLSENDRLVKFARNLRFLLKRFGFEALQNPFQRDLSKEEHRDIFEAIKVGNPEKAESLVRDHYLGAKTRLIKYMNKSL